MTMATPSSHSSSSTTPPPKREPWIRDVETGKWIFIEDHLTSFIETKKLTRRNTIESSTLSHQRSSSPFVVKKLNDEDQHHVSAVMEEEKETVIYHTIEPGDSLRWICLKYKVTAPEVREANDFKGNNLANAPKRLRIPGIGSRRTTLSYMATLRPTTSTASMRRRRLNNRRRTYDSSQVIICPPKKLEPLPYYKDEKGEEKSAVTLLPSQVINKLEERGEEGGDDDVAAVVDKDAVNSLIPEKEDDKQQYSRSSLRSNSGDSGGDGVHAVEEKEESDTLAVQREENALVEFGSLLSTVPFFSPAAATKPIYHTVEPGDSLRWICLKYKVTPPEVREVNNFTGDHLENAPKTLRIPADENRAKRPTRRLSFPSEKALKSPTRRLSIQERMKRVEEDDGESARSSSSASIVSNAIVDVKEAAQIIDNMEDDGSFSSSDDDTDSDSLAPVVGGGDSRCSIRSYGENGVEEEENDTTSDSCVLPKKTFRYKNKGGGSEKKSSESIAPTEFLSQTADLTKESDTIGTCDVNEILYHDIRPGDTLALLCQKYNITASDLRSCNIGLVGSNVQAGPKRLIIPPSKSTAEFTTSSDSDDDGPSSVPSEVNLILSLDNDRTSGEEEKPPGVVYHDRHPNDTLQSICFQYDVSPGKIRRANNFSGNDLVCAPERLVIPISTPQHVLTNDEKVESLQSHLSKLFLSYDDAVSFLELNDWNLSRTIRNVKVQKRYFSKTKRKC